MYLDGSIGLISTLQGLLHSDSARIGHLADQKAIKLSTYGINFVGTPHQGGNGVALGRILINVISAVKHTNHNTVEHLAKQSEWLQHLQSRYRAISGDFETVCYHETLPISLLGIGNVLVSRSTISLPSVFSPRPHCRSFQATQPSFKDNRTWQRLLSMLITAA